MAILLEVVFTYESLRMYKNLSSENKMEGIRITCIGANSLAEKEKHLFLKIVLIIMNINRGF